jgi:hypothetical protein
MPNGTVNLPAATAGKLATTDDLLTENAARFLPHRHPARYPAFVHADRETGRGWGEVPPDGGVGTDRHA